MASSSSSKGADKYDSPLPPALRPPGESEKADVPMKKTSDRKLLPMARRGFGSKGQKIQLQTNHFKVSMDKKDGFFYHYTVALFYEDKRPVEAKAIGRRVLDKVYETYASELQSKSFAYDGEKALFTITSLPRNKFEFIVVLDEISSNKVGRKGSPDNKEGTDKKRMRRPYQSKTFKVEISYAKKISMQEIVHALSGIESGHHQEAFQVLDIILRQNAAKQGCLLVRQSFFHDRVENYKDIGGGVQGCRGFHSSFQATQGGLSLNVDVSTTLLLKPGPVLDFLCANQDVKHPRFIDWTKAKRMLKNLRIKVNNMEQKITGLSDKPCKDQTFSLKQGRDANGEEKSIEITVSEYFERHKGIRLVDSANLPCINVGKPKKPTYFPIELCTLVSLQRYTKALTSMQRAFLLEVSRQKPRERMTYLSNSLRNSRYNDDPMLRSSGITIDSEFTKVEGCVLPAPKLKVGREEDINPRNGRWNFNNKRLFQPMVIDRWAIVNFSARCDINYLIEGLKTCARNKGMSLKDPFKVFNEDAHMSRRPPTVRVEELYATVMKQLPESPQFLLCILSEKKNSDIYGPWKRINLAVDGKGGGIVTQCIAPTKMNDQYFTNVLLKINVKLGGMNSFLAIERSLSIPMVSQVPTLILGMDVSHGSPGRSDVPSIAAVVSSRYWPQISCYRASVRAQSPKVEMIANLFNVVSDTKDEGIFRELLDNFIDTSRRRPGHIVIFRDGVSESQFNQVLNIELHQIIQACKHFQESWDPKFTVIIAQKNHHTRFFQVQANAQENVPPGTVVDSRICHPKNNDFYMCAHAGMIGTSRPTHYHVLHDEIGFSADGLQELVHSLCYVYQRSTTAISVVAPICYAHLAAAQVAQFIKFDEFSESGSSHGGLTSVGTPQVQELPRLHEKVRNSMFFC